MAGDTTSNATVECSSCDDAEALDKTPPTSSWLVSFVLMVPASSKYSEGKGRKHQSPLPHILLVRRHVKAQLIGSVWAPFLQELEESGEGRRQGLESAFSGICEATRGCIDPKRLKFVRAGQSSEFAFGGSQLVKLKPILFELSADKQAQLPKLEVNANADYTGQFMWVTLNNIFCESKGLLEDDAQRFPCLQRLVSAVYVPPATEELLDIVVEDRYLGASALTKLAIERLETIFQRILAREDCDFFSVVSADELLEHFTFFFQRLAMARPSMCQLYNVCMYLRDKTSEILNEMREGKFSGFEEAGYAGGSPALRGETELSPEELLRIRCLSKLLFFSAQYLCWKSEALLTILQTADDVLGGFNSVLLFSRSSVLETAIGCLAKSRSDQRPLHVVVCESRPACEGLLMACTMLNQSASNEHAIHVTVITEAQIGIWIEHVECVLIGADAIFADGSLINKVGSYMLALAANNAKSGQVPVFVLSSTDKLIGNDQLRELQTSKHDELELMPLGTGSMGYGCTCQHAEGLPIPCNDACSESSPSPPMMAFCSPFLRRKNTKNDFCNSSPFAPKTREAHGVQPQVKVGRSTRIMAHNSHVMDKKMPFPFPLEVMDASEMLPSMNFSLEEVARAPVSLNSLIGAEEKAEGSTPGLPQALAWLAKEGVLGKRKSGDGEGGKGSRGWSEDGAVVPQRKGTCGEVVLSAAGVTSTGMSCGVTSENFHNLLEKNRLSVVNIYFEYVPAHLIRGFITENGLISPDQIFQFYGVFAKQAEKLTCTP